MSDLFLTPVDYTIYAPDGSVVADAIVRFDLTGKDKDGSIIVPTRFFSTTDSEGKGRINAWPNARGVNSTRYRVAIIDPVRNRHLTDNFLVTVPESESPVNLRDIISDDPPPPLSEATQAEQAAQQFAANASASASTAEAAKQAAVPAAEIFATVAEGLSGVSDGDYFTVPENGRFTLYRNDSGSATEILRVPGNQDFSQRVESVEDLRAASFAPNLQRLWLSGYYGVGTAGGGPLYRDADDTTTADNGGTVFVDADGVRWKRSVCATINAAWFGPTGDGVSNDQPALQSAINYCVTHSCDLHIPAPKSVYILNNDLRVQNASGIFIRIDSGAKFFVGDDAEFDGTDIYPSAPELPIKRALLVVDQSDNVTVEGGFFSGAATHGTGMQHHDDGKDGCGILVFRSENIVVRRALVRDIHPDGLPTGPVTDNVDGATVQIRYNGIIAIRSKHVIFGYNDVRGIQYDAITCRVANSHITFVGNYAEDALESYQCTTRYGQADVSVLDPADRHNRFIRIMGNTGIGCPLTLHSQNVTCTGNTIESPGTCIDSRINTRFSVIANNTLRGGGASPGINLSGSFDMEISQNTIENVSIGVNVGGNSQRISVQNNAISGAERMVYRDESSSGLPWEGTISGNSGRFITGGAISVIGTRFSILGNTIIGDGSPADPAIELRGGSVEVCKDNVIRGYATPLSGLGVAAYTPGAAATGLSNDTYAVTPNTWTRVDPLFVGLTTSGFGASGKGRIAVGRVNVQGVADGDLIEARVADINNNTVYATGQITASNAFPSFSINSELQETTDSRFILWVKANTSEENPNVVLWFSAIEIGNQTNDII